MKRRANIIWMSAGVALMAWTWQTVAEPDERHIRIAVGDVIQVVVFETTASGQRTGNFVTLPSQMVDAKGGVFVPHAGFIYAAGRSIPAIEREIEARLAIRAIEPRVVVRLTNQHWT